MSPTTKQKTAEGTEAEPRREVILDLGFEGGCRAVLWILDGEKAGQFILTKNEVALYDMLNEEDLQG